MESERHIGTEDAIVAALNAVMSANIQQAHHHENQRATLTNFLITVNAAALAFVIQQKFELYTVPLSFGVLFLGAFGVITSTKFSQRFHLYYQRARHVEKIITGLVSFLPVEDAMQKAEELNRKKFGKMADKKERLELFRVWKILHLGMALAGTSLIVITAVTNRHAIIGMLRFLISGRGH